MQKRIFSAISLPEDVKKRLFRFVEKEYKDLPVKWVRQDNLHVTLNFLGYVSDENIPDVCRAVSKALENIRSFELEFVKSEAVPGHSAKKMIWASGTENEELTKLKHNLDRALGFYAKEKRGFRPHVTLGRIRKEKWKKISPEPDAGRELSFTVPVGSVELYESRFEKGKRVYCALESFPLK